jgi:hypothetical protein
MPVLPGNRTPVVHVVVSQSSKRDIQARPSETSFKSSYHHLQVPIHPRTRSLVTGAALPPTFIARLNAVGYANCSHSGMARPRKDGNRDAT